MTRYLTTAGPLAVAFAFSIMAALPAGAAPFTKAPPAAAQQGLIDQVGRTGGGPGMRGGGGGGPRMHGGGGGGPRFGGGPRPGGPRFGGGPRGPGRGHYHGPRPGGGHHHHRGPRFRGYPYVYGFGAYPYYYYDDYGSDYASCEPLRRRAVATRSRYWWNRYYACIED
ncbi:hypothetical protein [Hyphomicrobium sp. NDB2Meth4]|uniref:hypothetical protein n=1 Tax=Hyphomicrobium sp. NDB2Meth4 TaxID=1892846 RepID=UPI000931758A|nr:hypothetical protein [Hyphomicrobium sp. NDB2Meth4]